MNKGKYVFSQITDFISQYEFKKCVDRYQGDYRIRELPCWDQFLTMIFGQLSFRHSLQATILCLVCHSSKLYHLGFRSRLVRTTVSRANKKRDWRIYRDFAFILIKEARVLYQGDKIWDFEIEGTVYALDASIIDLCLRVFKWAKYKDNKGAVKLHAVIDLQGNIPTFIHITDGKVHDVNFLDILEIEVGAFYLMDRGYLDFDRLYKINTTPAFFITRAKKNMAYKRLYSNPVDKSTGVRCDQIIRFTGYKTKKKYPDKLRRVKYYDKNQDKTYIFLTNNFSLEAKAIADLYQQRWQIEIFFKWIKQHLKIKVFWGESENAVKTQIWIAVCTYLIVAIIKKKLELPQTMNDILQILSVSLFDKTQLKSLFLADGLQKQTFQNQEPLFRLDA